MEEVQDILGDMDMSEFLFQCRFDFRFFCDKLLSQLFTPECGGCKDFHLEWFNIFQDNNRVIIEAPSGFSKTTMVIAYTIWFVWNHPNTPVLITSKTLPQGMKLLEVIKSCIEENPLLNELKPKDISQIWSRQLIRTTNGCRIAVRPYSINIKGERAGLIAMDEVDSYDDPDLYFDYVIPRLTPNGKILMITTKEPGNSITNLIKDKKLKDYKVITSCAIIDNAGNPGKKPYFKKEKGKYVYKSIWPERFTMERLEKMFYELGDQYFEKNFMNNTKVEQEKSFFSIVKFMEGFDDSIGFTKERTGPIFTGHDFAMSTSKRADYDSNAIIEKKGNFYILKFLEKYRVPPEAKLDRLTEIYKDYDPIYMVCDESNAGSVLIRDFRSAALPVYPQKFSGGPGGSRSELLKALQNILDAGLLIIPRKPEDNVIEITNELLEQLMGFVITNSKQTGLKTISSTATHDDLVMAVAMAVKRASEVRSASMDEEW